MTEIQLNKNVFLRTLQALRGQFELATTAIVLETDETGKQFILTAKRENAPDVRAFGPCTVKGEPLNVEFDLVELEAAINSASIEGDEMTLLIGDGLWVKETAPAGSDED